MTESRRMAVLALITVAGAALRFYGLEIQSLWNDELSAWARSSLPTWRAVVRAMPADHPPGFSLFLHFWIRCFGDSETFLRLPSAIAGTLTIPAMFGLGRRLYSDREGFIAAALTAISWMPIYFSQEARANALILLCAVQSTSWLIDITRAWRRGELAPGRALLGYLLLASVASYAHYFGLLFVAFQGVCATPLLLAHPAAALRLIALYAAVLLAYSPWLLQASSAVIRGGPEWLAPPGPVAVLDLVRFLFNGSYKVALLVLGLWGAALASSLAERWRDRARVHEALVSSTMLLIAWLFVPVLVIYLRSVLVAPAFNDRNFIIVAPPIYLLTARAITCLPLAPSQRWIVTTALLGLLTLHLIFVMDYYHVPQKEQFREAAQFLIDNDREGTDIVIVASAWNPRYFDYYFERLGSPRRVDLLVWTPGDVSRVMDLVAMRSPAEVWLLAGHRSPPSSLVESLTQRFRLIDEQPFNDAHAWRLGGPQ